MIVAGGVHREGPAALVAVVIAVPVYRADAVARGGLDPVGLEDLTDDVVARAKLVELVVPVAVRVRALQQRVGGVQDARSRPDVLEQADLPALQQVRGVRQIAVAVHVLELRSPLLHQLEVSEVVVLGDAVVDVDGDGTDNVIATVGLGGGRAWHSLDPVVRADLLHEVVAVVQAREPVVADVLLEAIVGIVGHLNSRAGGGSVYGRSIVTRVRLERPITIVQVEVDGPVREAGVTAGGSVTVYVLELGAVDRAVDVQLHGSRKVLEVRGRLDRGAGLGVGRAEARALRIYTERCQVQRRLGEEERLDVVRARGERIAHRVKRAPRRNREREGVHGCGAERAQRGRRAAEPVGEARGLLRRIVRAGVSARIDGKNHAAGSGDGQAAEVGGKRMGGVEDEDDHLEVGRRVIGVALQFEGGHDVALGARPEAGLVELEVQVEGTLLLGPLHHHEDPEVRVADVAGQQEAEADVGQLVLGGTGGRFDRPGARVAELATLVEPVGVGRRLGVWVDDQGRGSRVPVRAAASDHVLPVVPVNIV